MPSDGSIGRQKQIEFERIEAELQRLTGKGFTLPRHNRHGADMLVIDQLRAIADVLEGVGAAGESEPVNASPYDGLNVPQLKKAAKERGLLSAELNTKVLLIDALEAADRAAEMAAVNG